MWTGIAAGLAAGALWGFAFIAPAALPGQSPLAVAIGRYLVYAVLCALLLARAWRRVRPLLNGRLLRDAVVLGLVGNAFYYCLLTLAVRYANSAVASLIIGTIPLWLALIDLAHTPRSAAQRRALTLALLLPLSLVAAGLVLINWAGLSQLQAPHGFLIGVLLAVIAAASWTAFAVFNARVVRTLPAGFGNSNWTNLLGIGSALGFLPLLPFAGLAGGIPYTLTPGLIAWSLLLGIGSSWVGSWLWNLASQRLPVGLVGQLIVAETVFALIYGFALGWRWPSGLELAAIGLFVAGVMLGIRAFSRAHAHTEPVH
ncbi:MAG TPA: DMT family transporter [Chitinolyticbacter sp.]|nr:DMT family transporter [Chitinolyticbacter sp.]